MSLKIRQLFKPETIQAACAQRYDQGEEDTGRYNECGHCIMLEMLLRDYPSSTGRWLSWLGSYNGPDEAPPQPTAEKVVEILAQSAMTSDIDGEELYEEIDAIISTNDSGGFTDPAKTQAIFQHWDEQGIEVPLDSE